ncbi:50S rRNA methyltransferase [Candidatus Saccharibacteria bacterium 32-50-10]|nr:MAG: 50S rRNA methyltransferase [Candidatus Saccharibacteria bacterium 32-50-10]
MPLTIVAVGKKHEAWAGQAISSLEKRLKAPFSIEWVLLPHSSFDGPSARQEESDRLYKRLESYDEVWLLDERGQALDSIEFANQLEQTLNQSRRLAIVIGGAYGVTDDLRREADKVLSLSPMVLAHQIVRVVIVEQIYRAQEIVRGGRYHHP